MEDEKLKACPDTMTFINQALRNVDVVLCADDILDIAEALADHTRKVIAATRPDDNLKLLREALEAARQRTVVLFQAYARGVSERHNRSEQQFIHDVNTFSDELRAALNSISDTAND